MWRYLEGLYGLEDLEERWQPELLQREDFTCQGSQFLVDVIVAKSDQATCQAVEGMVDGVGV